MAKKKLTALKKAKDYIEVLEVHKSKLQGTNRDLEESLSSARAAKSSLEFKIRTVKVKQFLIYDLTNGTFDKWQKENPNFEIISWSFEDISMNQFPNRVCLVFYK